MLILGLLLIAATAAEAAPEQMCPMIYRPVCAMTREGHHKTFSNDCVARQAGAIVRHEGACRRRQR
jgi:hypothetical protein